MPLQEIDIRQTFQQDRYLHILLKQQARELAGRPGWPSTTCGVYEQLLRQIEADVATSTGAAAPAYS